MEVRVRRRRGSSWGSSSQLWNTEQAKQVWYGWSNGIIGDPSLGSAHYLLPGAGTPVVTVWARLQGPNPGKRGAQGGRSCRQTQPERRLPRARVAAAAKA